MLSCREHKNRDYYPPVPSYMTCRKGEVKYGVVTADEFQDRLIKCRVERAASFDDAILRQSIEVF